MSLLLLYITQSISFNTNLEKDPFHFFSFLVGGNFLTLRVDLGFHVVSTISSLNGIVLNSGYVDFEHRFGIGFMAFDENSDPFFP